MLLPVLDLRIVVEPEGPALMLREVEGVPAKMEIGSYFMLTVVVAPVMLPVKVTVCVPPAMSGTCPAAVVAKPLTAVELVPPETIDAPPIVAVITSVAPKPCAVNVTPVEVTSTVAADPVAQGDTESDGAKVLEVVLPPTRSVYEACVVGLAAVDHAVSPSENSAKMAPLAFAVREPTPNEVRVPKPAGAVTVITSAAWKP
jgi:hypothetical protein